MQSLGILGGSFDPIHNGHLHIATQVERLTHLDEIRFIPCRLPILKEDTIANADQRFEMLNLALARRSTWYSDDRELVRETPSYMLDTLISLREEFHSASLNLILGWDSFQDLNRWHRWRELSDYANFVVVNRADVESTLSEELIEYVKSHRVFNANTLTDYKNGKIALLSCTELPISSREIREKLRLGEDVSNLVPANVLAYIHEHRLYI